MSEHDPLDRCVEYGSEAHHRWLDLIELLMFGEVKSPGRPPSHICDRSDDCPGCKGRGRGEGKAA